MTEHVHTIGADQTLEDAKQILYSQGFRHLPVLDGGNLFGILSDRDIKLAFAVDGQAAKICKVADACTTEVYSVGEKEELKVVVETMAARSIGCCVVVENGKVKGIFTSTDACRVLADLL